MKAYADYFGTQAENKIYVTIVPERDLAENLMEIEMVTCYLDNSSSRKSVVSDKQYQMYNIVSNQLEMLVYNTKTGICKDLKTRQAISAGINREKILANAYMGDGVLTDSIYYPNYLGVQDEGTFRRHTCGSPASMRACASSAESERQVRS